MIDINILFIYDDKFSEIKNKLVEKYSKIYNLIFLDLKSENLESEIKNSDIQIVIIGDNIENFTDTLYEKIENKFLSFFFHKFEVKLNKTNLKSIQVRNSLKKNVTNANSFNNIVELFENINISLEKQIVIKEKEIKPEVESTYLEAIKIKDYFSIKDMEIDDLKGKKEIYFVGENGDGKTVLLQAILLALKGDEYSALAEFYLGKEKDKMQLSTIDTKYNQEYKKYKKVKNIFAYGINRNKISEKLSKEGKGYSALFDTPSENRTTYLREPELFLKKESKIIDTFIQKLENLMGDKLEILKVIEKDKVEIKFKEVGGENIDFDMLSEGYKSTIIWLCDLLSRLMENQEGIESLEDFEAIVLIDEVDLYLHPKWKYDVMSNLRKVFEGIQFIMTTHSVVTVLGASEDAVFYKIYKEDGVTRVTHQIDDISNYTANILTTSPLFDLDSVTVRGFKDERLGSDDYIYSEIHKSVREYMKNNPSSLDEKVKAKVKEELKKRLAKLRKR